MSALAPALKYQALVAGDVDIIDAYSTDGLLDRYPLTVLEDDRARLPALRRGGGGARGPGPRAAGGGGGARRTERPDRCDAHAPRSTRRSKWKGEAAADVARAALVDLGLVAAGRPVRHSRRSPRRGASAPSFVALPVGSGGRRLRR